MRYLTVSQLREGMVLACPFYGPKFEILLAEGMTLRAQHIQRINNMGYAGVYIHDELSRDVVVSDIIPQELRLRTIRMAKDVLTAAEGGVHLKAGDAARVTREFQQKLITPVIDALIAAPNRVVDLIDLKPYDYYYYYHAANVVVLSLLTGIEMGISGMQLFELGMAALLHDIGNAFLPKSIINKPGRLTPEEYQIVMSHSEKGFEYLRESFDLSIDACMGALQHHENYDGSGYPNRLKRDKISIYGRIIAVTTVFDAMTSRRPYRQPLFPLDAMQYLRDQSGTLFDPDVVEALSRIAALYPAGVCVELNSGVRCIVVENFHGSADRPRLQIINKTSRIPMFLDLHSDAVFESTYIVSILESEAVDL